MLILFTVIAVTVGVMTFFLLISGQGLLTAFVFASLAASAAVLVVGIVLFRRRSGEKHSPHDGNHITAPVRPGLRVYSR